MPSQENPPLHQLLDAAGQVVQPTDPAWQRLPQLLQETPQRRQRRRLWWLAAMAPLATAACVLIGLFLAHFTGLVSPLSLQAAEVPIRVERRDVELTILSVSETEGATLYMPILQMLGRQMAPPVVPVETVGRQLSMESKKGYAPYRPRPVPIRTGQALVKDHRLVFNLKEGDNLVRFTDVAASIDPTSVRLSSDQPGTEVKEQNFEYDLVNADALLKRYLDRSIVCISKESHEETAGYLVSYDANAIVLTSEPPAPGSKKARQTQSLTRSQLQAIRLNEVPTDLLVKPTLVWKLRVQKAGRHEITLSYLCGLIKWQADYVVLVTPGDGQGPDLLDLTGWVSLDNNTGTTYDQAGLKLIAGDVNRKRDPWAPPEVVPTEMFMYARAAEKKEDQKGAYRKEFVEKSFFEYHLYTLTAPSTVRDREIKQLNLLQRAGIKANRRYVFDSATNNRNLTIELVAKNEKENHLGIPLPKGRVTFEQRDTDGETGFMGRTDIDHAAVKEELTLEYGHAFDVIGAYRQTNYQQDGPRHTTTTHEMVIRNHKTSEVIVRAIVHLGYNGQMTKASQPFAQHDAQTIYFEFPLKPNSEQTINYTVENQW